MATARNFEELIVWQLADQLRVRIHRFVASRPISRDRELAGQLQRAAASAPRLIAEGFGRYLPGDFTRYLRSANGELNEILDCLKDSIGRGYVTPEEAVPLQRLAKRTSKAATRLIAYLRTAQAPHEPRDRRTSSRTGRASSEGEKTAAEEPRTQRTQRTKP